MGRYLDTKEHKEWSKVVRQRGCIVNDGTCSENLDAHHIISKEVVKFRSNLKNGLCLCKRHHCMHGYKTISPHNNASILFFIWLQHNHPEIIKWVEENYEI